jgi:cytochrome P450/ferredoxin
MTDTADAVRVSVDHTTCVGSGMCAALAPRAFRLNGDGQSEVIGPISRDVALSAAEGCPVGAILVADATTGRLLSGSEAPAEARDVRRPEPAGSGAVIDDEMYADAVIANPYPYYGHIREVDPVHWNARYETWLVTRHEDIVWLLKHPELFSSRFYADDTQPPSPPIDAADMPDLRYVNEFRRHELIQNDEPDHRRMRAVVNGFFTRSRMEAWRRMVRQAVDSLLDRLAGRDGFDAVSDLGGPLPLLVISEMLDIPSGDRPALKEHADRRMHSALSLAPNRMRVAASGIRDTSDYLEEQLGSGLWDDGTSLMAILAQAGSAGSHSRAEVLANAQMLIDAGHETTIQLICNGLLAFMRNRDQWERFKAAPEELGRSAVEECLRYDPPLPAPRRLAAGDVELRGKTIRRGQRVFYAIAAGNRDPRVFEDPDRFDIGRGPNRHIAFGYGVHVCLGQYLARMEGQEVFEALAARMPDIHLATDRVEYAKIRGVRSLRSLPVAGWLS